MRSPFSLVRQEEFLLRLDRGLGPYVPSFPESAGVRRFSMSPDKALPLTPCQVSMPAAVFNHCKRISIRFSKSAAVASLRLRHKFKGRKLGGLLERVSAKFTTRVSSAAASTLNPVCRNAVSLSS